MATNKVYNMPRERDDHGVREKVGEALTDKPHRRSEIKVSALIRASALLAYITIWSYRQVVPDTWTYTCSSFRRSSMHAVAFL